ncbi:MULTISPECIES: lipopolysaccharide biosynthesis protein RfbH [unclassified Neptuniibacter]|uniref:lipopolysaccharide biosynthesis protein RfbH n=1 Tax=unclassified Neptuniibacter TaxID=2630693 RepID=UPI000C68E517|nr:MULTISPECIES: lipopolysaccharide biosynthesis protein RfbH [unclassified Neptuniibacter]MAY40959.1 lipopolysaccharide biosynthesis protein RfbH [Oceanospirillaceae bacterium]|tara:strand:+ start:18855 stop:20186 length:1332 start_codon:yes stop_codon:yes gene_type:complete
MTQDDLRKQIAELVSQYSAQKFDTKTFTPGITPIPPSGKLMGETELQYMVSASLDGWLTTGRYNDKFEEQLSRFLDVKHTLTTNSGSSANLLALATLTSPKLGNLALKPGDEVISVAAGFPTTINPIIQYGLVPVFVDIDIPTYNINPDKIEAALSPKTKAIMIAHTLGNPFDIDKVMQIANKYNLWVIEDTCDALGSTYNSELADNPIKKVGTFGDIGTLSFYPAHHITMGEGGAVYTNNGKLKPIIESFRDWGRDCFCPPGKDNTCGKRFCRQQGSLPEGYDHKYIYSHLGYNLKITDMQAACGLAQLEKVDDFISARKDNFSFLKQALSHLEEYIILPEATHKSSPAWFGFPITLREDSPISRVELLQHLDHHNIGSRLLFAGNVACQPYMQSQKFRISESLEMTDIVMKDTFWIGVQPALSKEMLEYSAETISQVLKQA